LKLERLKREEEAAARAAAAEKASQEQKQNALRLVENAPEVDPS